MKCKITRVFQSLSMLESKPWKKVCLSTSKLGTKYFQTQFHVTSCSIIAKGLKNFAIPERTLMYEVEFRSQHAAVVENSTCPLRNTIDTKRQEREKIYIKKENAFLLCSPTTAAAAELPCLFFQIGFTKVVNNFPEFRLSKNFRRRYQRRPMLTHFKSLFFFQHCLKTNNSVLNFDIKTSLKKNAILPGIT